LKYRISGRGNFYRTYFRLFGRDRKENKEFSEFIKEENYFHLNFEGGHPSDNPLELFASFMNSALSPELLNRNLNEIPNAFVRENVRRAYLEVAEAVIGSSPPNIKGAMRRIVGKAASSLRRSATP